MGAVEKIARAREHQRDVERLVQAYCSGALRDAVEASTADDGSVEYRSRPLPPLPGGIAASFGDCLQNARAALDHLIYDISTAVVPDFERTGYPVVTDTDPEVWVKERNRLLPHVPETVRDVIEAVQPFKTPKPLEDPLFELHTLAVIDRHRSIHLTSSITAIQHVAWMRARSRDDDPEVVMYRPAVGPGQLVLKLPPDPETRFTPVFEVRVVLGEADRFAAHEDVTAKVDHLVRHVEYLVRRVEAVRRRV